MSNKKHGHTNHHKHDEAAPSEMPKSNTPPEEKATDDALFPDDVLQGQPKGEKSSKAQTPDDLEVELQQANDRVLRTFAELENYRKRANREIEDMRKYAPIGLVRDMLSVWDDMGRALETVEKNHNPEAFVEGVRMVYDRFVQILERHHCTRIEAVGQPFDPNVHESIAQMPSEDVPAGAVLYESQIGFQLYDRVVRPTQVVISTGAPQTDQ